MALLGLAHEGTAFIGMQSTIAVPAPTYSSTTPLPVVAVHTVLCRGVTCHAVTVAEGYNTAYVLVCIKSELRVGEH